jgi:phospholipase C
MKAQTAITRRHFIHTAAGASGALGLAGTSMALAAGDRKAKFTDVKHIVVAMMENRSFDHMLGWLPGANGRQAGLTYTDAAGVAHSTHPLAPDFQGCGHPDPDHSHDGGLVEYNGGACDGWLRAGANDDYSIGYYTKNDLPFFGAAAPAWTTCDNYFAATLAETYPNRIYQHAAQTDRLENTLDLCTLPTIWDQLEAANVKGRYYFSDVPILALWGTKYLKISRLLKSFFSDCAAGKLPAVSFVEPGFLGESEGVSNDDHPHADIRNGQAFLNSIYNAVTQSPNWPDTVLIINYDEWGGFFEHVPPAAAPIPPADQAAGNTDGLRGFRVPALVISPWSRRGFVAHGLYDHTSVLRMIESRWGLSPLTVRDQTANNLADALDFTRNANLGVPQFAVPPGPFGGPCPVMPAATARRVEPVENKWGGLRSIASKLGFLR